MHTILPLLVHSCWVTLGGTAPLLSLLRSSLGIDWGSLLIDFATFVILGFDYMDKSTTLNLITMPPLISSVITFSRQKRKKKQKKEEKK